MKISGLPAASQIKANFSAFGAIDGRS